MDVLSSQMDVKTSNFRQVKGTCIYGMAQPSREVSGQALLPGTHFSRGERSGPPLHGTAFSRGERPGPLPRHSLLER